jgi:hypothetical protein
MTTTTAPAARPFPLTLEIHCNPDPAFVRELGPRVKALGGSYSDCRGDTSRRYVHDLISSQREIVNQGPPGEPRRAFSRRYAARLTAWPLTASGSRQACSSVPYGTTRLQ